MQKRKLRHIASVLKIGDFETNAAAAGNFKFRLLDKYRLLDKNDNVLEVFLLGGGAKSELVISPTKKKNSELVDGYKNWQAAKSALMAAGIFKYLGK